VGFATPAYQNSQFNPQVDREEKISIAPEVFSPDNDGYQDVTNITFTIEEPGTVATIKIFDSRGRLLRILANNLLLGINQTITWDGLDDKNQKAPMGIYVVFIELFDLEGNVKQYKKSVVVASKL
jgi:flagellar hook assembly protein FlgD